MPKNQDNFKMLAKTFKGLEDVLAAELLKLGAQKIETGVRNVSFYGDEGFMYKANLCLSTALSILKPILSFKARNEKDLYKKIYDFDWTAVFGVEQSFAIYPVVNSSIFKHSQYAGLKVKDAIVDRFRDATEKRPNVDVKNPAIKINVHINREKVNVSLDSSGEALFKRGYKVATGKAPLNEVMAAGLLSLSGWESHQTLLDPMCGSGTILIEAAIRGLNLPPQYLRNEFGFMHWKSFNEKLYELIRESSMNKVKDVPLKIIGADSHPGVMKIVQQNIEQADMQEFIEVKRADFFRSSSEEPRFILFNPPYNERIKVGEDNFYGKIGTTLKHNYEGSTAWFITSDFDGIKKIGLRPSRKIDVKNGALDCKFMKFEMYKGSKKSAL